MEKIGSGAGKFWGYSGVRSRKKDKYAFLS
jgi:hypothetical protein